MKSLKEIQDEITKAAMIPLPHGCAHDDGFDDFLLYIDKESKTIKNTKKRGKIHGLDKHIVSQMG